MKTLKARLDQRKKIRMTKRGKMKMIHHHLLIELNQLLKVGFGENSQVISFKKWNLNKTIPLLLLLKMFC